MEEDKIKKIFKSLRKGELPQREEIISIIKASDEILRLEPNLVKITGKTYVFGDIHGQFYDLIGMIDQLEDSFSIVFLGDYVDRGYNSLEVILYIILLKITKKNKIIVLRGNHENRAQTAVYGFRDECFHKFDEIIYWMICDLFKNLPIAAIIEHKYFCIHGGIIPELNLDTLLSCDRMEEFSSLGNVLWSDPSNDVKKFEQSPRGAGYLYGKFAVEEFLKKTGLKYLVRSHQLVFNGVKEDFDGKCITVWSAANYCYKCKNKAVVMQIDENQHVYVFFEAVKEQYKTDFIDL